VLVDTLREGQDPPLQWRMEVGTINPNLLFARKENRAYILELRARFCYSVSETPAAYRVPYSMDAR